MTSKIKVDNINKVSDDSNIINKCGTTITLGASGDTINLASGASQSGFGRTGTVDWQTGDIKTSTFSAVSGKGYFVNTTAGGVTVNLPAGTAGDIVGIKDYANTFDSYPVTLNPNGSELIGGGNATDPTLGDEGTSVLLVYVDGVQGWLATEQSVTSSPSGVENFISASGGNTCVTCGNYKTHIFTGPGTFTVSSLATSPTNNKVDYLVVAGGAGAYRNFAGGGGAGGFRMSNELGLPAPTTSPLANPTGITVTATGFPIAVGAGGAPGPGGSSGGGTSGCNSTFSSIISAGGGIGGASANSPGGADASGTPGGSGGGGDYNGSNFSSGAGNQPPVSPPQGNCGANGNQSPSYYPGGGGGAGAAGTGVGTGNSNGGAGSYIADGFVGPTAPTYGTPGPVGSTRYFAGGGGGAVTPHTSGTPSGGAGGGGGAAAPGTSGTTNSGGGAGGTTSPGSSGPAGGGAGGSGVVMIRYRYQ